MAYVRCTRCGFMGFSVAYWSNVEHCACCDEPLPRPRAGAEPIAGHPRFLAERFRVPRASLPSDGPKAA